MLDFKYYLRYVQLSDTYGLAFEKHWDDGGGALYFTNNDCQKIGKKIPFLKNVRHASFFLIEENTLLVLYSVIGSVQESILSTILIVDIENFKISFGNSHVVRQPTTNEEGGFLPKKRSRKGKQINVRQLRDPFVFRDKGKTYLYYTGQGESLILGAMAEIYDNE